MSEEVKENNTLPDDTSSMNDSVTKQARLYKRNRILALIGLGVFLFFLCGYIALLPFNASRPLPVSETPLSSLTIDYFSPNTLEVGIPATFSVSISNSTIQINTTEANQRLLTATPIPNGTPDVPLSQAFGPGYMVFAYAQLDVSPASKFDLPQLRQDSQSLEQQQPTFSWTITPKETTPAVITVTITGQWKPKAAGNEIDIPLWVNHQGYDVSAPEPFIVQAYTTLGSVFYAVLPLFGGLGLTIPWILDQIRKKRDRSKHNQKKRTQRGRKQR